MPYDFDQIIDRRSAPNRNKWNFFAPDVLPMWVADMDFRTPQPILDALRRSLGLGILGYQLAGNKLLELVAARLEKLHGWQVTPEMVVPVPGLEGAMRVAAILTCAPGEGIIVQPPVYFQFNLIPGAYGFTRQDAPLQRSDSGTEIRYSLNREALERAVHANGARSALLLICQPHNPTGMVFSASDLEWMAGLCEREGLVLCSDEIHGELTLTALAAPSPAAVHPGIAGRSITLIGPGKAFNMSGLACAFAVIPDAGLRQRFEAEIERQALHVNALGLDATLAAYSGECDEWQAALRRYLLDNRNLLCEFIQSELPELRCTRPEATYLAWLDFNAYIKDGRIVGPLNTFLMERARLALSDGEVFGAGGEGMARLNFACPRLVLEEGLIRLKRALTV